MRRCYAGRPIGHQHLVMNLRCLPFNPSSRAFGRELFLVFRQAWRPHQSTNDTSLKKRPVEINSDGPFQKPKN